MQRDRVRLEVCVDSLASADAAIAGGADRLELCASLAVGGLTPSLGMLQAYRERITKPLMAMMRPRDGDFCYGTDELAVIEADIAQARSLGIDGVVLGVLDQAGQIPIDAVRRLVDAARPMEVTFHRAFDLVDDPFAALDTLLAVGVNRILTSGRAPSAWFGRHEIAQWIRRVGSDLTIMPGGGVTADHARQLVLETGARELHASCRSAAPREAATTEHSELAMQLAADPIRVCSAELVRRLVAELP